MITSVKLQNSGYLVNGNKSVPNDPRNTDYQAVQRWLIGHTDDYLIALKAYNDSVADHDNWLAIQSYETDIATYEADLAAYNDWVFSLESPDKPKLPTLPVKPQGYYTQEEVDASEGVLKRPADIPEPTVLDEPVAVPNTPDPEFTAEELAEKAANQYKVDRAREYPPIQEQLDMIYHDVDNWRMAIKAIKDKYPKPV